jgi:hypothetical protein
VENTPETPLTSRQRLTCIEHRQIILLQDRYITWKKHLQQLQLHDRVVNVDNDRIFFNPKRVHVDRTPRNGPELKWTDYRHHLHLL